MHYNETTTTTIIAIFVIVVVVIVVVVVVRLLSLLFLLLLSLCCMWMEVSLRYCVVKIIYTEFNLKNEDIHLVYLKRNINKKELPALIQHSLQYDIVLLFLLLDYYYYFNAYCKLYYFYH